MGADHRPQGRRSRHRCGRRALDENPDLVKLGVGYLLYGLLDYIVDGQFEAVQSLDDSMEELEAQLLDDAPRGLQVQLAQLPACAASSCARAWCFCAGS